MSILAKAKINEPKLHLGSSKHKSEDYKITAVKYYLENDTNYTKTCKIFKYSLSKNQRFLDKVGANFPKGKLCTFRKKSKN